MVATGRRLRTVWQPGSLQSQITRKPITWDQGALQGMKSTGKLSFNENRCVSQVL